MQDPAERGKISDGVKRAYQDNPRLIDTLSRKATERFTNPEERIKTSIATKKAMNREDVRQRLMAGIEHRSENQQWLKGISIAAKRRWKNPEYRAKQINTRKAKSLDPANREANILAQGGKILTASQEAWIAKVYTPRHPKYGLYPLARKFGIHARRIQAIVES